MVNEPRLAIWFYLGNDPQLCVEKQKGDEAKIAYPFSIEVDSAFEKCWSNHLIMDVHFDALLPRQKVMFLSGETTCVSNDSRD